MFKENKFKVGLIDMKEENQVKVLNIICSYYGIDKNEFSELLKNREKKFLLLLVLKNNNVIGNDELIHMLGMRNVSRLKSNFRKAEEKFLINSFFREKYIELEEKIKKQID